MGIRVKVFKTIGDYVALEALAEDAINVINMLKNNLKRGGEDIEDAIRIIHHFDTFYDFMRKKFKEYLTPRKGLDDILKKRVIIDRLKLIKRGDSRFVEIIFDKSISMDEILTILLNNGIEVEKI